jgi:hypothetical protein
MKSRLKRQLVFDHYESEVRVEEIGLHGNRKYYAWITYTPSEGIHPTSDIIPLTKSEVLLRLDLLEEHRGKPFSREEQMAIDHLFKGAAALK